MFRWHRWQFGVRTIVMVLIFKETFVIFNLCLNARVVKLFLNDESIEKFSFYQIYFLCINFHSINTAQELSSVSYGI